MSGASDYAFYGADSAAATGLAGTTPAAKIQQIQSDIGSQEIGALLSGINESEATSNQVLTYGVMLSRNGTLQNTANALIASNKAQENGTKDTYARQGEINEWQAQNKLDTLFFLQLMFLYLTLVVILAYFRQTGLVPSSTYWIINVIFGIILIFTLWNRASYTAKSRDKRYWNRRFIGLDDAAAGLTAKLQCGS